jgi:hypothetical protein
MRVIIRTFLFTLSLSVIFQSIASAQKAPEDAGGEAFVFEFRADYWFPTLSSDLKVDNGNLSGTNINVVRDLGFDEKKPFPAGQVILRLADRHKLRLDYLSFAYSGDAVATSEIVFHGATYPQNSRLKTNLDLSSIRAGYEVDLSRNENGYFSFRVGADFMKANATIDATGMSNNASASAVAPVAGLAARFFLIPRVSLNADVSGEWYDKSSVFDGAVYADLNIIRNLGVTVGWRTLSININVEGKMSDTRWSGAFAGLAFRF